MSNNYDKAIRLRELAERQGGFFSAQQAIDLGFNSSTISYFCVNDKWLKADSGLYRLSAIERCQQSVAESYRWCLWSRSKQGKPQGVLCGLSALYYHGLLDQPPAEAHLTVPPGFRKTHPQVVLHKKQVLLQDLEKKGMLRVTKPLKSIAEAKVFLDDAKFADIVRLALRKQLISTEQAAARGWINPVREGGSLERMPMGKMFLQNARSAFTLVELLVVVAIISILASLLMPVLGTAIDKARNAQCHNNLKQAFLGMSLYIGDYQHFTTNTYTGGLYNRWPDKLWKCDYGDINLWRDQPSAKIGPGCPSKNSALYEYALNDRLTLVRFTRVRKHSQTFMVMDANYFAMDTWKVTHLPTYWEWRHARETKIGMVFVDGHVVNYDQRPDVDFAADTVWGDTFP